MFAGKIFVIMVIAVLKIFSGLISAVMKLTSLIAGPFLAFSIGCSIYCIATANWKSLLIFGLLIGTVIFIYMAAGIVLGLMDIARDRLWRFIRI